MKLNALLITAATRARRAGNRPTLMHLMHERLVAP
jgi:hypothetical protein